MTGTPAPTPAGTATPIRQLERNWGLDLIGHALLSDPPGAYAEGVIRSDGRYALLGSEFGTDGTFLVDLADPTTPRERHRLPTTGNMESADVSFDPRDGLYYRSLERDGGGIDVVDYGYADGTPTEPQILATMPAGNTHNLHSHTSASILYGVNPGGDTPGLGVWDVADPADPVRIGDAGPAGDAHDVVVDAGRDLLHVAYIGGALDGYVILDSSDPTEPREVGRFDYADHPGYDEVPTGTAGFENCHFASYDPTRDLAIVGDETISGVPGGKHVFDIGWGEGSPANPIPIGFTRSPNATTMVPDDDPYAWTGHNFTVVPRGEETLLVSGDYADGAVLYDLTDPTAPGPLDRFETVLERDRARAPDRFTAPPRAWSADYAPEPDLIVVSDVFTGLYVFRVERPLG
ncbi:MAG: hypothetical protein R3324_01825 [Halobacteriales archaeon]|nr:hypothetical protein [Halobacteriales archaeon]